MSSEPSIDTVNPDTKSKLTPRELRIKRIRDTGDRIRSTTKENIDLQPRLFMTALFAFAIVVINTETSNLRNGHSLNWSNLGGLVVIGISMWFTLWLDNRDGLRRLEKGRLEVTHDLVALRQLKKEELETDTQGRAVSVLIDQLIKEAGSVSEKIKVIAMVPQILSLLPVETINKTIAQGFEGLSEAIGIVMMDATGSVSNQIRDTLVEMLPKDLKAKSKPVSPETLVPTDPKFPTEESIADQLERELGKDKTQDGS